MTPDEATTDGSGATRHRPPWAEPGPEDGGAPWAATAARPAGRRATQRVRRVVEGLPEWDPMPPGESLVRRPGTGEGT